MTEHVTPELLWRLPRVGRPEPLPDGDRAVVPVTTFDADHDSGSTRLWLVERSGTRRPLTRPDRNASSPAPSPDGDRIAFLSKDSDSDEPSQVHVLPTGGGEAEPLAAFPLGAVSMRWLPDGTGLVVAAPLYRDHPTVAATESHKGERKERSSRPVVTEDRLFRFWKRWLAGETIDHFFLLPADGSDAVHLTPGFDRLTSLDAPSFDVSPDGEKVVFAADVSDPPWDYPLFALFTVPTAGGEVTRVDEARTGQCFHPRFSPDGTTLAYLWRPDPTFYADRARLVLRDLASGGESVATEDWALSCGTFELADDGSIVIGAEDAGRNALFHLRPNEVAPARIGAETLSADGPRPAGGVVWHRVESLEAPPEAAVSSEEGTATVTSFAADALDGVAIGRCEEITVTAGNGDPIQVFVTYPPAFDEGRTWPLLQNVHGGPHNATIDGWHWRWNTQVMAAAGYVVVSVNFHGSSSWTEDFTRSIQGAWGDLPAADIEAATDALIARGIVDESRMAIAGGSYGGYLTSWITTQTDRYRCAVVHAGVTDLLGQWASDVTAGREAAVGGVPWEDMEAIQRWSPAANTEGVVTPTLVIHGEADYRVVITQGLLWYGILKAKGVEARLVYYPDEGHWIEKRSNALHWWGELLGWIERHT